MRATILPQLQAVRKLGQADTSDSLDALFALREADAALTTLLALAACYRTILAAVARNANDRCPLRKLIVWKWSSHNRLYCPSDAIARSDFGRKSLRCKC
ncbi:hypothetical protein BAUCODRAFT_126551 [Baudoinia panamericana UAMH 10762]|uniref:Uncharacterized protein n=1 Tax=Baudoinia panamericana (strain UAMH 10762) TaxID=717646 RepID=M2MJQ6_BAUPA|nr:uncharacterized protein BAUCODRAFT_126551 [Baudoinia panamericana UAMH 10762]EMC91548.1 hypothetical protein BAUCODRAFT_126551 [Baudoinia panamericana UAMH 10762]